MGLSFLRRRPLVSTAVGLVAVIGAARAVDMLTGSSVTPAWLSRPAETLLRVLAITNDAAPAQRAPGGPGGPGGPPPAVTVSRPAQSQIVEWDEYTGRFDAIETVEVRARVAGYLDTVHFTDGQIVAKGDLLFTIDRRPFERTVDQARAEVEQARTKLANANLDVTRGEPLVERKVMSQKTFDDRANLKREAEAAVKVSEAKLRTAELDLDFTRVTAPISGRMSRTYVTAGNYVSAGGAATPTLLTTIVSESPIYLYFDVSEANAIKYRRLASQGAQVGLGAIGATVEIGLPDEQGWPHRGAVNFSDNRLDAATGTLRARVVVDNAKRLFTAGMFARVRVAASKPYDGLLLPDSALGTDQAARFVLLVADDGSVQRRIVTTGPLIGGLRVIRSGIASADWVVVNGLQRARPGQKVQPKREVLKLTEAAGALAPPVVEMKRAAP